MEASKWGTDGRDFAVVADETRRASAKISESVDKSLFDEERINQTFISEMASNINLLAFNAAIEASRSDYRGKGMAVCADDIRNLAKEMKELLDDKNRRKFENNPPPYPSHKMTSIDKRAEFIHFTVNGYSLVENVNFIKEILPNPISFGTHINVRGESVPVADCITMLGGSSENAVFLRVRTPWAKTNGDYMVAVDEYGLKSLFNCPIGVPVPPAPDMKLKEYARECWDSTDGEQFRFIDWTKIA
jgi:hypothetical protein